MKKRAFLSSFHKLSQSVGHFLALPRGEDPFRSKTSNICDPNTPGWYTARLRMDEDRHFCGKTDIFPGGRTASASHDTISIWRLSIARSLPVAAVVSRILQKCALMMLTASMLS